MKTENTSKKLQQLQHCLNSLGVLKCRALFEGYSLSINNLAFAMLVKGQIFLRVCDGCQPWLARHNPPVLNINPGEQGSRPDYYLIEEHLWNDPQQLLYLSTLSLKAVCREKLSVKMNPPLEDLPGFSAAMIRQLINAGIKNLTQLQEYGSREVWLRLVRAGEDPDLTLLYVAERTIQRRYMDELPVDDKNELKEWYEQWGRKYKSRYRSGKK